MVFCVGLALPSLSSKGMEVTQQATLRKTRCTQIAFTARKGKETL